MCRLGDNSKNWFFASSFPFNLRDQQAGLGSDPRHRTKKPETYSPRQSETRLRMDLAHEGQQFEHISTCMPWSVNTAHSSRRYMRMRPPKKTQQRNPGSTQIPGSTARTPCYPTTTHVRAVTLLVHHGYRRWEDFSLRTSTFGGQVTRTPPCKPLKNSERRPC